MKIIRNSLIPFKGFVAINLFGVVFVRKEVQPPYNFSLREWDKVLNHELIHTKQMQELLFVTFYVWYLLEWLVRLVMYRDRHKAYRNISFEREAYANQCNWDYNKERKRYAFIRYIKQ
ncbi:MULTISPECIES: hypothetical protein [Bacteroidales]|uniref:hypothetical protein n=1 Tax=Bacteroides pyogenes TaxID=310300 RepID=UPI002F91E939